MTSQQLSARSDSLLSAMQQAKDEGRTADVDRLKEKLLELLGGDPAAQHDPAAGRMVLHATADEPLPVLTPEGDAGPLFDERELERIRALWPTAATGRDAGDEVAAVLEELQACAPYGGEVVFERGTLETLAVEKWETPVRGERKVSASIYRLGEHAFVYRNGSDVCSAYDQPDVRAVIEQIHQEAIHTGEDAGPIGEALAEFGLGPVHAEEEESVSASL